MAAYEKAGLSEEEALTQARVARILRYEDVGKDFKPILWTPKGSQRDNKVKGHISDNEY